MESFNEDPIVLLAAFEKQIFRALARRSVNWRWVGYSEPDEFIRLIEDLLWALTLSCRQSRPIYKLCTFAFPLGEQSLAILPGEHWCFAPPHVRRCLFASVLAIIGNPQARAILHHHGAHETRWIRLINCLDGSSLTELERRSWLWPPAAHNAFARALRAVRGNRSARAAIFHFY